MTKILVATTNRHKLDEIVAVMAELPVVLVGLDALDSPDIPEPVEDGDTFEANALLKAHHYAGAAGMVCLADDSGLAVDALGGAPGVLSARYSDTRGPRRTVDAANNRRLLDELVHVPIEQRAAGFVCAMALVAPPGAPPEADAEGRVLARARGTVRGRILSNREVADPASPHLGRGENGFGYDPLFFLPELGKTSAELTPQQKNRISHRGDASRKMAQKIRALL